jgi:hypothetical protein
VKESAMLSLFDRQPHHIRKEGPMNPEIARLQEEIRKMKEDRADREAALPAHSIRPHQLLVIEELEEEIARKQKELDQLMQDL